VFHIHTDTKQHTASSRWQHQLRTNSRTNSWFQSFIKNLQIIFRSSNLLSTSSVGWRVCDLGQLIQSKYLPKCAKTEFFYIFLQLWPMCIRLWPMCRCPESEVFDSRIWKCPYGWLRCGETSSDVIWLSCSLWRADLIVIYYFILSLNRHEQPSCTVIEKPKHQEKSCDLILCLPRPMLSVQKIAKTRGKTGYFRILDSRSANLSELAS
jgi:hypothetical protein